MYGIYAMAASGRMQYDYKQTNYGSVDITKSITRRKNVRTCQHQNCFFGRRFSSLLSISFLPPIISGGHSVPHHTSLEVKWISVSALGLGLASLVGVELHRR